MLDGGRYPNGAADGWRWPGAIAVDSVNATEINGDFRFDTPLEYHDDTHRTFHVAAPEAGRTPIL